MLPKNKRYTRKQLNAFLSINDKRSVYNSIGTFTFVKESGPIAVVSRKTHEKRAFVRNKARRRLYTLFGATALTFSGVLYLSRQSYTLPFDDIKKHFANLMEKALKAA